MQLPPQSTSVSVPLSMPSLHDGKGVVVLPPQALLQVFVVYIPFASATQVVPEHLYLVIGGAIQALLQVFVV